MSQEKETSKVIKCTCRHSYQDGRYGRGMRLHTVSTKGARKEYKCTVCGDKK